MNSEEGRLRSFQQWPMDAPVDKQRMARGGFYYLGHGLEVQCFSCHSKISDWNYGDRVMARHKTLSPDCKFVEDPVNSGNIPLGRQSSSEPESLVSRLSRLEVSVEREHDLLVSSPYRTEEARLQSFRSWPKTDVVHPSKLAKSGFFFTQMSDKVQCAFCSATVMNWESDHDPDTVHVRIYPSCGFMISKAGTQQITSKRGLVEGPSETLGVYCHKVPNNLAMSSHGDRLNTFASWQKSVNQDPEDMADAGFYFCGPGDLVKCFHCGVQIEAWEPTDNPWREHARLAPQCGYVRISKGLEFTNQCANNEEIKGGRPPNPGPVRIRSVSEDEVQNIMLNNPITKSVLEVGVEQAFVKRALKDKLELTGVPFNSADELLNAALDFQREDLPLSFDSGSDALFSIPSFLLSSSRKQESGSDESEEESDPGPTTNPEVVEGSNPPKYETETEASSEEAKSDKVDLVSLEKELKQLRDARLCKICLDKEICILFVPCLHLVTCIDCGKLISNCPICRKEIDQHIRTYLS